MEKKERSKFIILVPVLLIIAVIAGWYYLRTWPLRFQGQLDNFFGKDAGRSSLRIPKKV